MKQLVKECAMAVLGFAAWYAAVVFIFSFGD
jgi:hypothetical protein